MSEITPTVLFVDAIFWGTNDLQVIAIAPAGNPEAYFLAEFYSRDGIETTWFGDNVEPSDIFIEEPMTWGFAQKKLEEYLDELIALDTPTIVIAENHASLYAFMQLCMENETEAINLPEIRFIVDEQLVAFGATDCLETVQSYAEQA